MKNININIHDEKIGYGKKVLYLVDGGVTDWNDVEKVGWYSGNNALNSPETNTGWFQVLVIAENANNGFLHCIGFTVNTKKIYGRVSSSIPGSGIYGGLPDWTDSKWFSYN